MLSPTPAPETVLQSEPDYLGVTGLWALPARPGDAADAVLVLSTVSGSRALSTGTQLPCPFTTNPHLRRRDLEQIASSSFARLFRQPSRAERFHAASRGYTLPQTPEEPLPQR